MKTFITLLAVVLAMVFVVPAFAGEEPYKAAIDDDYWSFHGNCSITKTQPCLTDRDCPPGHCSITTETTCYEDNDCPHRHCSLTGDGCSVAPDCPGRCDDTGQDCSVNSDCPGRCSYTGFICSVNSDCPDVGRCDSSGFSCLDDSDCEEEDTCIISAQTCIKYQFCDEYQSCDADTFDTETCSAIETCLLANSNFHISPKLNQFTHENTAYYDGCEDVLSPFDPRVDPDKCDIEDGVAICPSKCSEKFDSKTAATQPEVCCAAPKPGVTAEPLIKCPDIEDHGKTSLTGAGNSGWYEWTIALPKKPEGELNLEIQCGVLKPNSFEFLNYAAIMSCAAETGEPIGQGICTRVSKGLLRPGALPKITVIAAPGCQNDFDAFHLTAYRNPGTYAVAKQDGHLVNNAATQVLNGTAQARIALKGCLEKTVMIKWPVEGTVNALGETEANLEAGDLIKVRMDIPTANTVDVYCGKYSLTIGGIGEPSTLLDDSDCNCINVNNCQL